MQKAVLERQTERVRDWMISRRLDKGAAVMVEAVIKGLGEAAPPTRDEVVAVLNAMVGAGVLAISGGKYKVTAEGVLLLYPGSLQDHVDLVVADLQNYMFQNDPVTVFKLQEYQSQIPRRLNPRQASVVNDAIRELVKQGDWEALGRDTYRVSQ